MKQSEMVDSVYVFRKVSEEMTLKVPDTFKSSFIMTIECVHILSVFRLYTSQVEQYDTIFDESDITIKVGKECPINIVCGTVECLPFPGGDTEITRRYRAVLTSYKRSILFSEPTDKIHIKFEMPSGISRATFKFSFRNRDGSV